MRRHNRVQCLIARLSYLYFPQNDQSVKLICAGKVYLIGASLSGIVLIRRNIELAGTAASFGSINDYSSNIFRIVRKIVKHLSKD